MTSNHTILLTQLDESVGSKQWDDFDGIDEAMQAVCRLYEAKLKREYPTKKQITYEVQSLFEYIQSVPDMSCLVFSPKFSVYEPKGKSWIKDAVLKHLKKQATLAQS